MPNTRRSLILTGLAVAAGYGAMRYGLPTLRDAISPGPDYVPVASPQGFRRVKGGAVTAGLNPVLGIDGVGGGVPRIAEADLCRALFPGWSASRGTVPIASFSDYNCPYCRVLTGLLAERANRPTPQVEVFWHELPVLGVASSLAAHAALAAERQDAYLAFHARMMRSRFLPTERYLTGLAESIGLDAPQFLKDLADPEIAARIQRSASVARVFGFVGTPSLLIGRTAVEGELSERFLDRLIAAESPADVAQACS